MVLYPFQCNYFLHIGKIAYKQEREKCFISNSFALLQRAVIKSIYVLKFEVYF